MLEPEEVDEGYFTPAASMTLASIFKSDSDIDASVNSSLKYKPPQLKKTEETPKSEDANASHCVFSCSIIAYEWIQGAHKCKGKVGFAVVRMIKTGICKMILYSPDKSTLSCTTLSPELHVTLKGAMITLYDDHKKYWGLCFNDITIDKVKEILQQESSVIKDYESPQVINSVLAKHKDESKRTDEIENETENINILEVNPPPLKNDKASILSRIANVGHAILPSTPASPVKKSTPADIIPSTDTFESTDTQCIMSDERDSSSTKAAKDLTRNIAIQVNENDHEVNNSRVPNVRLETQVALPRVDSVRNDNEVCPGVSGHTVPMHKFIPIVTNLECGIRSSEIEMVINKLSHLQGLIKAVEIFETFEKENNKACLCKDKACNEPNLEIKSDSNIQEQNRQNLEKISNFEELIREKDSVILNFQSELKNMIPRSEADMIIANTVKKLMNNTFRSLASNFESDATYTGSNVKGILATVIKKQTVESLNSLLPDRNASNVTPEPKD